MSKEHLSLEEKKIEKCEECKVDGVKAWFKGVSVCIGCYNKLKEER